MKHFILCTVIAAFAQGAIAGISYRFESVSEGFGAAVLSGTVEAEGDNMRVDIQKGDGFVFRDSSYVIASHGTISIVDPAAQTYSQIPLQDLGGASIVFQQLRGIVDVKVENPRVTARSSGNGPVIAGYPTKRQKVDGSADLLIDAAGQKTKIGISMSTESWTTDRLPGKYANVLDSREIRTGIRELDALLDQRSSAAAGFPLKRVSTISVATSGAGAIQMKSTTTVSAVEMRAFVPAIFALPAGYARVPSPLERAAKALMP